MALCADGVAAWLRIEPEVEPREVPTLGSTVAQLAD
jgi:hypothetical protein